MLQEMCIRDRVIVGLPVLFLPLALEDDLRAQVRPPGNDHQAGDAVEGRRHPVRIEPVSYTHLDVYKRQAGFRVLEAVLPLTPGSVWVTSSSMKLGISTLKTLPL